MDQRTLDAPISGEITLTHVVAVAWRVRWVIVATIIALTAGGFGAGLLIVKQYRAEVIISPVTDSPSGLAGSLSGLASQYGELASMAGISMSGKGNKDEAIAVLQSELITEAYLRQNDLLPVLYPKRWNAEAKKWTSDDPKKIPTYWKANQYFKKTIRELKQDKQTGLVTMHITWSDPVAAATWANDLVSLTNRYLRDKAINESEKNIAYLNEQAAKTPVLEARTAIYSILKEEVNKQMIAKGREEYALKVIDPARVPETPSSPSPLLLGLMGFVSGLCVSGLLVWRRSLNAAPRVF